MAGRAGFERERVADLVRRKQHEGEARHLGRLPTPSVMARRSNDDVTIVAADDDTAGVPWVVAADWDDTIKEERMTRVKENRRDGGKHAKRKQE